jgi:hypothetical protein
MVLVQGGDRGRDRRQDITMALKVRTGFLWRTALGQVAGKYRET